MYTKQTFLRSAMRLTTSDTTVGHHGVAVLLRNTCSICQLIWLKPDILPAASRWRCLINPTVHWRWRLHGRIVYICLHWHSQSYIIYSVYCVIIFYCGITSCDELCVFILRVSVERPLLLLNNVSLLHRAHKNKAYFSKTTYNYWLID